MKKSWIWILILFIIAIAAWGLKGTLQKGKAIVDGAADAVVDAGEAVVDGAADAVVDAGEAVVDGAADAVEGAADAVVDAGEAVVDGAADAVEGATDAVIDAGEAVVDGAADAVDGDQDTEKKMGITKNIDVNSSAIKWTGRSGPKSHNGVVKIQEGSLQLDDNGDIAGGRILVDMSTIQATDIDSEKLDNHLKAPDFFDAENHPTATLEIVDVSGNTANGILTIKDTPHPVEFEITTTDTGASTSFGIDSTKWGVADGGVKDALVSDNIDLEVSLAY